MIYKAQEEIETISMILFEGKYRVYNSAIIIIIEDVNWNIQIYSIRSLLIFRISVSFLDSLSTSIYFNI